LDIASEEAAKPFMAKWFYRILDSDFGCFISFYQTLLKANGILCYLIGAKVKQIIKKYI
jgi:hypothetical protein